MRRLHKILLGVFCGGVLLSGIGAGVAFAEFSSLAYAGERMIGETRMETAVLEAEIDPEQGQWYISVPYHEAMESGIETDESVPENTVQFHVSYNAARVTPEVHETVCNYTEWLDDEQYVEEELQVLELYTFWEDQDEMKIFMELKDQFLADLKEGKIASYQEPVYVENVEIRINPANEDDVSFL